MRCKLPWLATGGFQHSGHCSGRLLKPLLRCTSKPVFPAKRDSLLGNLVVAEPRLDTTCRGGMFLSFCRPELESLSHISCHQCVKMALLSQSWYRH